MAAKKKAKRKSKIVSYKRKKRKVKKLSQPSAGQVQSELDYYRNRYTEFTSVDGQTRRALHMLQNKDLQSRIDERLRNGRFKVLALVVVTALIVFLSGCSTAQLKATEEEGKAILGNIGLSVVKETKKAVREKVVEKLDTALNTLETKVTQPIESWRYSHYKVQPGDSLWKIASSEYIYGDPFMWPALFKKNRDQIRDPDLIEEGIRLDFIEVMSPKETRQARQIAFEYDE